MNPPLPAWGGRAVAAGMNAAAVGVGEQNVVVLGQEARRRGGVGIWPRRVGQVEELLSVLVAEDAQARAQPLDHLAQPGEAAPGLRVLDAGGAVRPEVADDHLVRRWVGIQGSAEPGLGEGQGSLPALPPDAARRHLD